jgi:hypothetical protein
VEIEKVGICGKKRVIVWRAAKRNTPAACAPQTRPLQGDDVTTSWRVSEGFSVGLVIPDLWQQEAIRALQQGKDVVVQAPTGSGKTYIFELFYPDLKEQAVFTVPTRAVTTDSGIEPSSSTAAPARDGNPGPNDREMHPS